jgi:YbbR domain-containing protein
MRKFFFENLGLKIAAISLAIILWVFVTSRGQSEKSIDVPLEFTNIPSGLEIVNSTVKEISLNIKGQERLIRNTKPLDIRALVDMSKAKKGESTYYITREDIKVPSTITVTNISPSSVKVITDETVKKSVKVRPVIIGEPERGYYVKSVEVTPQTVVIEGVRPEVRRFNYIKTEPLDISGLKETFIQEPKLDLTGKNIRTNVNTITVKIIIGAETK